MHMWNPKTANISKKTAHCQCLALPQAPMGFVCFGFSIFVFVAPGGGGKSPNVGQTFCSCLAIGGGGIWLIFIVPFDGRTLLRGETTCFVQSFGGLLGDSGGGSMLPFVCLLAQLLTGGALVGGD